MTSSRPYLVRALYEWILDNGCTPHVVVDALIDGVEVPQEHVKDGQIVLNVSPVAVQDLIIDDHYVSFNGRFAGVSRTRPHWRNVGNLRAGKRGGDDV